MKFKVYLLQEAKQPLSPDYVLSTIYQRHQSGERPQIIPPDRMKNVPYYGGETVKIWHGGWRPNDPVDDIKPGDWISLNKAYALQHARARGSNKVVSKEVPAQDVSWAGTDENEWFYTPKVA